MTYEYCKRNTLRSGHNHTVSVDVNDAAKRNIFLNYYNEYEPFAAEWLKELIEDGLIPNGEVDTRSIVDVAPEDLKDFYQCHFFAGIGGWAYAARLAGWGDDRPMWTGSPPCQPFSVAGKQDGASDERHLWPIWFDLLRKCRPPIVFGEQVSAAITFGWLDQLQTDLESSYYSCGAILVPASGVGALHQRERLWFVADCMRKGLQRSYPGGRIRNGDWSTDTLDAAVQLTHWLTPTTSDTNGLRKLDGKRSGGLNTQANTLWPTVTTQDNSQLAGQYSKTNGTTLGGAVRQCSAKTEKSGSSQLNPRFSLWLMGYPTEWACCAERVTRSSRKSRQK